MLLAVDIGNSSTKFGIFDQAQLVTKFSIPTKRDHTPATLAEVIGDRLRPSIDNAIVCSVVPGLDHTITYHLSRFLNVQPRFVTTGDDFGFIVNFPIDTTGTDRLVNASAAAKKYGIPVIVISFGTATTIDVVNAQREYLGGLIAPGMKVSARALSLATSKLPEIEIAPPDRVIATDTENAIRSGIVFGQVAMIEGLLKRIIDELTDTPRVIATGGFAEFVAHETDMIDMVDADLTLYGLELLERRTA